MAAAELLAQAKQLAKDGNHLRASAAYFKAAKKEPENPEILIELALALLQLNKVSKALAAADDAIRIDPVSQKAYYVRGLALTGLKRLEDAVGSLQRAVEIGGDASAEIEAALAETKWQLRQQHEEAGTECPAVARDAEAPKDGEPELSAKDKMAFIRAQNKKNRQSKFARGQMADKGKAVTEVLGELAKDAEARADHVAQELSIGTGGEEGALLRYSAERVQRFLQAQLAKLAEALGDAEDADQYARPVAIVLPGKEAAQEEGPARLVSTDGGLTYTKEVTSDVEGQGVAMTGAFESMAQQKTAIPFLRKMVGQTAAHAVLLVVPKAAVKYPRVWEADDAESRWPADAAGCTAREAEGWYIQLDAKQPQDSGLWWLGAAVASKACEADSRQALHNSFSLIDNAPLYQHGTARQIERSKSKKKGKKGKKNRG